ncbi:MAG: Hsp20/alpha crystallin family protein [Gammaproteobacteria bacterium]|nr:molecular chaperone Hsp20 [Gammaproteobacteria bacterium]
MAMRDLVPWIRRSRVPITRRQATNPFVALHEEMNRLFEDFWRDFEGDGFGLTSSFSFPRIETSETDKEFKIAAELPGMDENDVELLLDDNYLTIRGEKRSEREDESRRMSERFYGRFERHIPLPVEVDQDKVSATFKKGVLYVTLPKLASATERVRRIPIKT